MTCEKYKTINLKNLFAYISWVSTEISLLLVGYVLVLTEVDPAVLGKTSTATGAWVLSSVPYLSHRHWEHWDNCMVRVCMWSPRWCRGLAVGQVDGTEQAGCEWAARVFHLALRDRKGWCGAAGITDMRYHCIWQPPPPNTLVLHLCFGSQVDCALEFLSSCPSPAISWFLLGSSIQICREGTSASALWRPAAETWCGRAEEYLCLVLS